jgi:O-antigen/teichoic acid export membrane protein
VTRGEHRRARRRGGYLASVSATAGTSVALSALSAAGGLILARYLGPAGRGTYAVVTSYMLTAQTIGCCGLPYAVCYAVARNPSGARDAIRTGGALLWALGTLFGAAGIAIAPVVVGSPAAVAAFRVAFAAQPLAFAAAVWVFTLQATRIGSWNVIRALQPVGSTTAVLVLAFTSRLTVERGVLCLVASLGLQGVAAAALCRRVLPGRGRLRRATGLELARYGCGTTISSVPYLLNTSLDMLLLGVLAQPAQVGHYAVAVSMSLLPQPVCSAFGNVAMPRLAAGRARAAQGSATGADRRVVLASVGASLAVGVLCIGVLSAAAPLAVRVLLGRAYAPSLGLFWLLAPGAAVLGCNRVIDDVLRGLGRTLAVARCEWAGTVLTVAMLAALVPTIGVAGAAVASSVAYGVTFVLLLRAALGAVGVTASSVPGRLRRVSIRRRGDWLAVPSDSGRGNA